ncbi:MAG: nucleotide exchange factor GrpE, partial [Gammaproteobacteria bacterium]
AHKYALDKFINELLPVLDSMEMGIVASVEAEDVSSLREGLELTLKMFCSSLEKSGVHPVNPQKGDKFNPEQHEAMTMQEVDDVESGTVVTTLQKGYELNGRLIRPAMVIVAK